METRGIVLGAIVLVAAIVASIWLFGGDPETAPAAPDGSVAAASPPTTSSASAAPAADKTADAPIQAEDRDAVQVPTRPPSQRDRQATLRGRCVDARGTPLADCRVHLRGRGAGHDRQDAWLLNHAELPDWTDPPEQTTGADGTFEFEFWPPPPFQFELDVTRDGSGALQGWFPRLAEGSTADVGDILIQPGVRLRGVVVGTDQKPRANERVNVSRIEAMQSRNENSVGPRGTHKAVAGPSGTLAFEGWLAPGRYRVWTPDVPLQSPKTIELAAERPVEEVTVVVDPAAAPRTIRGRVLDHADRPVSKVRVTGRTKTGGFIGSGVARSDGTFELKQRGKLGEDGVLLAVQAIGYDVEHNDALAEPVPWGTDNLEFKVVRGGTLTLRVTGPGEEAITDYNARLIPKNRTIMDSNDARVRAHGPHDNGIATIDGLTRGDWLVVVEFAESLAMGPLFEPLQLETSDSLRLDLRATPLATRTLRVVFGDDTPVAGTHVRLSELFGREFSDKRSILTHENWMRNSDEKHARIVFEGTTDAEGRVALRGPGGRSLGLCLLGPGHVPISKDGVRLDPASELVVRVGRGASLVGTVGPPAALAELRRLARLGPDESFGPDVRPTISLATSQGTRFPNRRYQISTDDSQMAVNDDGSFAVSGIPVGRWKVAVGIYEVADSSTSGKRHEVGQVVLTDGENRFDIDLSAILPGTIVGQVLINGTAAAEQVITLKGDKSWANLTTDTEGRFEHGCLPGTYSLLVQRPSLGHPQPMLRCPTTVTVVRGVATPQTFAVAAGTLQLRVLDPGGQPVAGLVIELSRNGEKLPPTNEDGRTEAEVTAQNATLRVLPKRLQAMDAQRALRREARAAGRDDPFAGQWVGLGPAVVQPGQTEVVEIRLPPEWNR